MIKYLYEKFKPYVNIISISLVVLSLCFVIITHYKIYVSNIGDIAKPVPRSLLALDLTLIILICSLIGLRIRNFINKYLKGNRKNRLQRKIINIIILFSVLPPLLCITYFYIYFSNSSKMWFNNAIDKSLKESLEISKIYVDENKARLKDNLFELKRFTEKNTDILLSNPIKFDKKLSALAASRSITEAVVMINNKKNNKILSKTSFSFYPSVENFNIQEDYKPNDLGISIIIDDDDNYMRAITKLDNMPNTYILLGILINDKVIMHIKNVQGANKDYNILKSNIETTQKQFLTSFTILSFLVIISLILLFIIFISKYILPLLEVINGMQKISDGNYTVKLDQSNKNTEISLLFSSFNKMVTLIAQKNNDLSYSMKLSESKKDFLEYILGSLPTAVIYINPEKNITLYNQIASELLDKKSLNGANINDVFSGIEQLIKNAENHPDQSHNEIIKIKSHGKTLKINLSIAIDFAKGEIRGFIINFLPI
ncbi:hypothetical protein OAP83_00565 [Rickettsiales bacterium]|nr:hypothetical protein [Rickettsiales bacterium]